MSVSRRNSLSPPKPPDDLKHRVITCLNKLSDRDTIALATTELKSIATTLTSDSFSPFLSCIYNTDDSSKSPVRKQCVHLLTFLSHSHGDALSPFLSKMISTVVRRLRDSDSAVRSACVEATAAMSSQITKPPFSYFFKPLMETLTVEQDLNSQIGSALCLAAAVESAPDPDVVMLRRSLSRLGKLVKSEGFKAKAAVLVLIGSVVGVGGASSRGALDYLVPSLVEFLSSEDWAVRKAAAETLGRVAMVEKDLAGVYKALCVSSLESRRFDKIKAVREMMNLTLELWKEIPGAFEEVSTPSPSKSPSKENSSRGCFPRVTKSSCDVGVKAPLKKTVPATRSPSSAKKISPSRTNNWNPSIPAFSKLDHKKPFERKNEVALLNSPPSKVPCEGDTKRTDSRDTDAGENRNSANSITEHEYNPLSNIPDEKSHKYRSLRSGSRVVPFQDDENPDSDVLVSSASEEVFENHKDAEDLSLIRDQLLQIENQQSSLLDLLQRLIGSSQSGMNSLETRVNGLEAALDEISYDLALSSGRLPNGDFEENTCCKLPGAEFLSSKFWRRTEGRYFGSRFSSTVNTTSVNGLHHTPDKDVNAEPCKQDNQRFLPQSRSKLLLNPSVVPVEAREN